MRPTGLVSFRVVVGETDLWVAAARDLSVLVRERVCFYRRQLRSYIARDPDFATTLHPREALSGAPPLVSSMLGAGRTAGVGPMAAVAGAIAEAVGRDLAGESPELIVENGGDLYIRSARPRKIAIFAGSSPLSERIGLDLRPSPEGLGVCTSAGRVGPSLSLGRADAATIVASDAALADAAATALGNMVKERSGLEAAVTWAVGLPGVMGALAVFGETVAAAGDLELVPL